MVPMRNILCKGSVWGLIAAVLALAVPAAAHATDFKKEYKLQVNVGPSFYWGIGATKFADLAREKTNGQINIKPYFGSALLKGAQLKSAQMVAKGVIDCAYESTINISPVITECQSFFTCRFLSTHSKTSTGSKTAPSIGSSRLRGSWRKVGLQSPLPGRKMDSGR